MANVLNQSTQSIIRPVQRSILGVVAQSIVLPPNAPSGGGGGATIFHDTFTDVDNRTLPTHTPDTNVSGNPWVNQQQAIQIKVTTFDKARGASNGQLHVSTVDMGESDVIITWDGKAGRTGSSWLWNGVCFRYTDLSNYFHIHPYVHSLDPWEWRIYENTGSSGEPGTIRAQAVGTTTGDVTIDYSGKLTLSGDNMRLEIPAQGIDISYNSSVRNTVTTHGLIGKFFNISSLLWDNLIVTTL